LPIIPPGTSITATKSIYVLKKLNFIRKLFFWTDLHRICWSASISPPSDVNSCSPCHIVGEYRTAPSGGGLLVPEKLNQHYDNALVLCPRTKLYRQPPVYYYRQHSTSTEDTAPQCVYYLNPVAHTGDYFTGPLGTGKDPSVIQ
jgi:hypothetical protein